MLAELRPRFASALIAVGLALIPAAASAQIVRVGPFGGVRIRAPFVRVDVSRLGGTRVRAPFTRIRTPGYGAYRPSIEYPPLPPAPPFGRPSMLPGEYDRPAGRTGRRLATPLDGRFGGRGELERPNNDAGASVVDPRMVRAQLRSAAMRLRRSLSRRENDADAWMEYLAPARIIEVIDRGEPASEVKHLVGNYDGVVANPRLTLVAEARGFEDTRFWLKRFVTLGARGYANATSRDQRSGAAETSPASGGENEGDEDGAAAATKPVVPQPTPNPQLTPTPQQDDTPAPSSDDEILELPAPAPVPQPL